MRTSYELPLNNMMLSSHFKTLVKVQRINGFVYLLYIYYMDNCKVCSQPSKQKPVQSQQNNVRTMFI